MSSRALRKLQGRGEVMQMTGLPSESSDEEVETTSTNMFALVCIFVKQILHEYL